MKQDQPQKTELIIPTSTYVKTLLLILATVLVLAVLHKTAHALVVIFTAFFLALALNAPVSFIARHIPGKARGSRAWATSIAFLLVVIVLGAFLAATIPPLVRQTHKFIEAVPGLVNEARTQHGPIGDIVRKYHLEKEVGQISTQLKDRIHNGAGTAVSTVKSVGSSAFTVLTVLALTFMMLVEGPRRLEFFHELVPGKYKKVARDLAGNMYRVVKGYVNGQVILAALASLLITPALVILKVPYAVGLVFVVFVCGLIPMVGHTIGAIICTLVALFQSPTAAIITLAYYILYQQVENYLIQPRVQANSTDMSPLLVFASVVVGVSFSGLLGGLVAIPVAGCLRIVILEILDARNLRQAPVVHEEIHDAKL